MVTREIKIIITLPDEVAQQAEARGLLAPAALEQLIRTEIERRRKVDRLFDTMDQLEAVDIPPLTDEELNAEIKAARAERRARRAHSS